jgi:hypothetical protein
VSNNDFPLFFTIAVPLLVSGLIGIFAGIIPWHIFVALLIALYVILCVANSMDDSKRRYK